MNIKYSISIVIPARNEEKTIAFVIQDCIETCRDSGINYEIIVVDDGSQDNTIRVAQNAGATIIKNTGRHGKGAALRLGFQVARYNTIVMLDADYSHRAEDITLLLTEFKKGYGLVVGNRFVGGSDEYNIVRALGNKMLTLIFCQLFGVHLNDAINGFKIFDKRIFDSFTYAANDFSIEIELLANTRALGLSIGQVPTHERARRAGKAKSLTLLHGFSFLARIIRERAIVHRKVASLNNNSVK